MRAKPVHDKRERDEGARGREAPEDGGGAAVSDAVVHEAEGHEVRGGGEGVAQELGFAGGRSWRESGAGAREGGGEQCVVECVDACVVEADAPRAAAHRHEEICEAARMVRISREVREVDFLHCGA